MKCSGCGFNTFDYLENCKKCGNEFNSNSRFKELYKKYSEPGKQSRFIRSEGFDNTQSIKPEISISHQPQSNSARSHKRSFIEGSNNPQSDKTSLKGNEKPYIFEPDFEYDNSHIYVQASGESRIAAFIIDFGILNIISISCICSALLIMGFKIDKSLLQIKDAILLIYLALMFLCTSYFVLIQGFGGRTIGKLVLNLKVIKKDGLEIGLIDSFIRFTGYFISVIPAFLGFIWSYIDTNSQAWHDKIAGTVVVEK